MPKDLNWPGIIFGAAAGLVSSYILFAISGSSGRGVALRLLIQLVGFVIAGFIAWRFSLVQARAAGGFASLILFAVVAGGSIVAGVDANVFGLAVLGALAIFGGSGGAIISEKARRS